MKKSLLLRGLCVMFAVCAALHPGVYANGQSAANPITLNVREAALSDVFGQIERQSGYRFVYSNELLRGKAPVTLVVSDTNIANVMNAVLRGSQLAYEMQAGNTILVKAAAQEQQPQQRITATGTVYDNANRPLTGVTVVAQSGGTIIAGVATDSEGKFSITIPERVSHLTFSFIGYTSAMQPVDTNKPMTVHLTESVSAVDEVVVTGYQTIRREHSTGSTVTLTEADIEGRGYTSVEQVLMGAVSGLNMVRTGRPGQDAQIQIRGANSLTGSTDPIWIVDGMPMQGEIPNIRVGQTDLQTTIFTTGIGNLAPDDIKSITVLKDAAATAIYGARAANGVIVVETKSGTIGKTRFNASVNFGLTERPRNNIDMMNTAQKIELERQIFTDEQLSYIYNPGRVTSLLTELAYETKTSAQVEAEIARLSDIETDWFREIFDPAFSQQYNLSMSGGSESTQHYASLNYTRENGTVPNNVYERMGMNIKLTHRPSDKVLITAGLQATMRNDRSTASVIDPLDYAIYANPYERPYNDDGTYAYDQTWDTALSTLRPGLRYDKLNVLEDIKRNTNTSHYLDAELSLKVEWEILNGLMFTSSGVYNANANDGQTRIGAGSYTDMQTNWYQARWAGLNELTPDKLRGSLRESSANSSNYTWRNTLQYSKEFGGRHFISLFAGQEIMNRMSNNMYNFSPVFDEEHYLVGFPELINIGGQDIDFSALGGTGKTQEKLSSFFANASYSFEDRYILTGSIRYDGSDIIGNQNQFTPLWNVGARWNLHRENFMGGAGWVDILSLRAGFGYTGSIDKNALPFTVITYGNSLLYNGELVPASFRYADPNVKWQTKQDFNVGLEAAFFANGGKPVGM